MAAPALRPADDRTVETIADILLTIETAPAVTAALRAFAHTAADGTLVPVIAFRLGGQSWTLSPADTRVLARCLQWDGGGRHAGLLASLFEGAACDAEAIACPTAAMRRNTLERVGAA